MRRKELPPPAALQSRDEKVTRWLEKGGEFHYSSAQAKDDGTMTHVQKTLTFWPGTPASQRSRQCTIALLQNEIKGKKKIEKKKSRHCQLTHTMDAVVGVVGVPRVQCRAFPSAPQCAGSTLEKIAN